MSRSEFVYIKFYSGGCPGQRGSNILKRDGRIINLGAKFTLAVKAGVSLK